MNISFQAIAFVSFFFLLPLASLFENADQVEKPFVLQRSHGS